eukprot:7062688-Karenia_brevis.AAC.1
MIIVIIIIIIIIIIIFIMVVIIFYIEHVPRASVGVSLASVLREFWRQCRGIKNTEAKGNIDHIT